MPPNQRLPANEKRGFAPTTVVAGTQQVPKGFSIPPRVDRNCQLCAIGTDG